MTGAEPLRESEDGVMAEYESERLANLVLRLKRVQVRDPVQASLAQQARQRREASLRSLSSRIARTVLTTFKSPTDSARKVLLFVGERPKGPRAKPASGPDRRWTLVPKLIEALNAVGDSTAVAVTVNEAYTSKSCPDPACRRSREGTASAEK